MPISTFPHNSHKFSVKNLNTHFPSYEAPEESVQEKFIPSDHSSKLKLNEKFLKNYFSSQSEIAIQKFIQEKAKAIITYFNRIGVSDIPQRLQDSLLIAYDHASSIIIRAVTRSEKLTEELENGLQDLINVAHKMETVAETRHAIEKFSEALGIFPKLNYELDKADNKPSDNKVNFRSVEIPIRNLPNHPIDEAIFHDRTPLGFLSAGKEITIRQDDQSFIGVATIRLLNNNSKKEETFEIRGVSSIKVTASEDSAIFIDRSYYSGDVQETDVPKIVIENPENIQKLPHYIYHEGDKDVFFELWDKENTEYALLTSRHVNILVSREDKEKLRSLDVDAILQYYDDLISYYDKLAGYSDDAKDPIHKNIPYRIFIKVDKEAGESGDILAYFGANYIADTASLNDWFFPTTWKPQHEIGHNRKYEGIFLKDHSFFKGAEVGNNIFADFYRRARFGDQYIPNSFFLYENGNQELIEKEFMEYIEQSIPVHQLGHNYKVLFMMLIFVNPEVGESIFTEFNRYYREMIHGLNSEPSDFPLLDVLSEFLIDRVNVDITAFIQAVKGNILPEQAEKNSFKNGRVFLPISLLVDENRVKEIQQKLNLESSLSLINSQKLKSIGLDLKGGPIKLHIEIDDFSQIRGKKLLLMDGHDIVREITIDSEVIELEELPVGGYQLRLPTGEDQDYLREPFYLVVKEGTSKTVEIKYTKQFSSDVISQNVNLLMAEQPFAQIAIDYATRRLTVDVNKTEVHEFYKDTTYSEIRVKDSEGNIIFEKTFQGNLSEASYDEIEFQIGDEIEITNREPSQVRAPFYNNLVDTQSEINTFLVTASGLKNKVLQNNPEEELEKRLDNFVEDLRAHPEYQSPFFSLGKNILLAINTFTNSSKQEELRNKYQDVLGSLDGQSQSI